MILALKNKNQITNEYFWTVILIAIVIVFMDVIHRTGKFPNIRRVLKNIMLVVFVGTAVGALNDGNTFLSWVVMIVITGFILYEYYPYKNKDEEINFIINKSKINNISINIFVVKETPQWKLTLNRIKWIVLYLIVIIIDITLSIWINIIIKDNSSLNNKLCLIVPVLVALYYVIKASYQKIRYMCIRSEKRVRKLIRELSTIIIVPGLVDLSMGSVSAIEFTILGCLLVGWSCWYED